MNVWRAVACQQICNKLVKEFWRKTASQGSGIFTWDKWICHRPVVSIAFGCHAVIDAEWSLCIIHRNRHSQCFSMGQTTAQIFRLGISTPSNTWFSGLSNQPPNGHLDRFKAHFRMSLGFQLSGGVKRVAEGHEVWGPKGWERRHGSWGVLGKGQSAPSPRLPRTLLRHCCCCGRGLKG